MNKDNFDANPQTGWGGSKYHLLPASDNDIDPASNLMENYLMGYVDSMKSGWAPMRVTVTGNAGEAKGLKFEREATKMGWTYTASTSQKNRCCAWINNEMTQSVTGLSQNPGYNGGWTIMQEFEVAKYTWGGYIRLRLYGYYPTVIENKDGWETIEGTDLYGTGSGWGWTDTMDAQHAGQFFNGSYDVPLVFSGIDNRDTVKLSINDWNVDTCRFEKKVGGRLLCFHILGAMNYIEANDYYNGQTIGISTNQGKVSVGLCQKVGNLYVYHPKTTQMWADSQTTSSSACFSVSNTTQVAWLQGPYTGNPSTFGTYGYLSCDFYADGAPYNMNCRETDLDVPADWFTWLYSLSWTGRAFAVYKGMLAKNIGTINGDKLFALRNTFNISQVKTVWAIINKNNQTAVNGYNTDCYTSIFNPDDSPSFKQQTGTDETLDPILRPWQKLGHKNWEDTFEEDDIPEPANNDDTDPEPEEGYPDNDDDKDDGQPPELTKTEELSFGSSTKFHALSASTFRTLLNNLAIAVQDSYSNPTDGNKFLAKCGDRTDGNIQISQTGFVKDYIISCRLYPFTMPESGFSGGTKKDNIAFGYMGAKLDCDNYMMNPVCHARPVYINVPGIHGMDVKQCTFRDFEPYAKYSILLPFIGEIELPAHNVVCSTICVYYTFDFSTGTCACNVTARGGFNTEERDETPLISKSGICSSGLSIAGNDVVRQSDQISLATLNAQKARFNTVAGTVAEIGGTAGKLAESAVAGYKKGGAEGAAMLAGSAALGEIPAYVQKIGNLAYDDKLAGMQKTIASRDVPFNMSFGSNPSIGYCYLSPSVRVQRASTFEPPGYAHTYGLPLHDKRKLSSMRGFVQCASPDVTGIPALEAEQQQINELLRQGIYMG